MAKSPKVSLQHNQTPKLATQVKINEVARLMAESAYTYGDVIQYCEDKWGLSRCQGQKYYTAAAKSLLPEDPDLYRDTLIARNLSTLEAMLKKALDGNNLKVANDIIGTINKMLGVGNKAVEIKDKDSAGEERTISISFGE